MNKKKSILLIIAVIAICFFIYLFKGNFNKGDYSQTYYDLNTAIMLLKKCYKLGATIDSLKDFTKRCENWTQWKDGLNQFIEESEDSGVDIISICKRNNINPNDIEDIIEKVGELYYALMDELIEKSDFLGEREYSKIAK